MMTAASDTTDSAKEMQEEKKESTDIKENGSNLKDDDQQASEQKAPPLSHTAAADDTQSIASVETKVISNVSESAKDYTPTLTTVASTDSRDGTNQSSGATPPPPPPAEQIVNVPGLGGTMIIKKKKGRFTLLQEAPSSAENTPNVTGHKQYPPPPSTNSNSGATPSTTPAPTPITQIKKSPLPPQPSSTSTTPAPTPVQQTKKSPLPPQPSSTTSTPAPTPTIQGGRKTPLPAQTVAPTAINVASNPNTPVVSGRKTPPLLAKPTRERAVSNASQQPDTFDGTGAPVIKKKGRFVVTNVKDPGFVAVPIQAVVTNNDNIQMVLAPSPHIRSVSYSAAPNTYINPEVVIPMVQQQQQSDSQQPVEEQQQDKKKAESNRPRHASVPHAARAANGGLAAQSGLGKVFYFLDQMRTEVADADKTIKTLQADLKFVKEKNKELEMKVREAERKAAEEKAAKEASEKKCRALKKKLRLLQGEKDEPILDGEKIVDGECTELKATDQQLDEKGLDGLAIASSNSNLESNEASLETGKIEASKKDETGAAKEDVKPSTEAQPATSPKKKKVVKETINGIETSQSNPKNPLLSKTSEIVEALSAPSNQNASKPTRTKQNLSTSMSPPFSAVSPAVPVKEMSQAIPKPSDFDPLRPENETQSSDQNQNEHWKHSPQVHAIDPTSMTVPIVNMPGLPRAQGDNSPSNQMQSGHGQRPGHSRQGSASLPIMNNMPESNHMQTGQGHRPGHSRQGSQSLHDVQQPMLLIPQNQLAGLEDWAQGQQQMMTIQYQGGHPFHFPQQGLHHHSQSLQNLHTGQIQPQNWNPNQQWPSHHGQSLPGQGPGTIPMQHGQTWPHQPQHPSHAQPQGQGQSSQQQWSQSGQMQQANAQWSGQQPNQQGQGFQPWNGQQSQMQQQPHPLLQPSSGTQHQQQQAQHFQSGQQSNAAPQHSKKAKNNSENPFEDISQRDMS